MHDYTQNIDEVTVDQSAADAHRKALADARQASRDAHSAVADAKDRMERAEDEAEDGTISPEDFAAARQAVDMAILRAKGADRAVKTAERRKVLTLSLIHI